MTRAIFDIKYNGRKIRLGKNSNGYPDTVIPIIDGIMQKMKNTNTDFDSDWLSGVIHDLYLIMDYASNVYYFYEFDFDTFRIKCWESKFVTVKAPADWKKRGYGCAPDGTYPSWRKGKIIINKLVIENNYMKTA